jgi:hypothetical protein
MGDRDIFFISFLSTLIAKPLFGLAAILAAHVFSASETASQIAPRQRN